MQAEDDKSCKGTAGGLTEAMHISSRRLAGAGPRLHALSLHKLMQKLLHAPYLCQAPVSVSKHDRISASKLCQTHFRLWPHCTLHKMIGVALTLDALMSLHFLVSSCAT